MHLNTIGTRASSKVFPLIHLAKGVQDNVTATIYLKANKVCLGASVAEILHNFDLDI